MNLICQKGILCRWSLQVTLVDQLGSLRDSGSDADEEEGGRGGSSSGSSSSSQQEARRVAYFLFHNIRASHKRPWVQQSGG